MEEEYLPLMEAAKYARVSRVKIWQMVRDGRLQAYSDPRDARSKLVKREELDAALRIVPIPIEDLARGKAAA